MEVELSEGRHVTPDGRRPRARARNWSDAEMMCLAQAKKYEQDLDLENAGQRRFLSSVTKWSEVAAFTSEKGTSSYYNLSKNQRIQAKLVHKFDRDLNEYMESFCMQRLCMAPPQCFDSGLPSAHHPRPPAHTAASTEQPTSIPGEMPSQQTFTSDNKPIHPTSGENIDLNETAPGDRAPGSTGRTKRRRGIEISTVLKSSHENLISSLDKQMTERMAFYEKQLQPQQAEQESLSADRKAMVSVLREVANAMNVLARK